MFEGSDGGGGGGGGARRWVVVVVCSWRQCVLIHSGRDVRKGERGGEQPQAGRESECVFHIAFASLDPTCVVKALVDATACSLPALR